MGIQINFSNKTFYLLVGILVLIGVAGVVFAYNSGVSPSVMGHTADEIDGLPSGGGGNLSCTIKSSTSSTSTVTLCCDSGYIAVGMNVPEYDIHAFWANLSCVNFNYIGATTPKQIMCCKT